MPKLVLIKSKKLIKILKRLGFSQRDAEGSHVFFKHLDGRTTVIPVHNRELSKGLLRKILNDIELSIEEYERLRKQNAVACELFCCRSLDKKCKLKSLNFNPFCHETCHSS